MSRLTAPPVVEFYLSGETKAFARLAGVFNLPQPGETIEIHGVMGAVVTRTWNLDYAGAHHEQWRCNIYMQPLSEGGEA